MISPWVLHWFNSLRKASTWNTIVSQKRQQKLNKFFTIVTTFWWTTNLCVFHFRPNLRKFQERREQTYVLIYLTASRNLCNRTLGQLEYKEEGDDNKTGSEILHGWTEWNPGDFIDPLVQTLRQTIKNWNPSFGFSFPNTAQFINFSTFINPLAPNHQPVQVNRSSLQLLTWTHKRVSLRIEITQNHRFLEDFTIFTPI